MADKIARRTDFKCEPFGAGIVLPFSETYSHEQFERISRGLIPWEMEDKWIIFLEDLCLYLHRSWTGKPVYKVEFEPLDDCFRVKKAMLAEGAPDFGGPEYQAALLAFLIGALLLGEHRRFPKPAENENDQGAFQHHIVGRAYPEKEFPD